MIRRLLRLAVHLALTIGVIRLALEKVRWPGPAVSGEPAHEPGWSFLKRWLFRAAVLLTIGALGGGFVVLSGVVPIKASSGHWSITEAFLQFAKRRSVATHSMWIQVPPLDQPRHVLMGAGHYDFACAPCHGSPGAFQPRIAAQMLPRPPDLRASVEKYDPEDLFHIVKHGIKLTGMPAWPAQQRDDEVWAMVAFLRQLPGLDARTYARLARGDHAGEDTGPPIQDLLGPAAVPRPIAESCGRCHGIDGLGRGVGAFPRLAGQRPAYLMATMHAYARGERHSGIMEPVAAALGPDEIREIAKHYSGLPTASLPDGARDSAAEVDRGRTIATGGLPEKLVPACSTCHGPGSHQRNATYPLLSGQYAEYIRLQLSLFKEERRGGTAYRGIMRKVASQLTDEEMRAVAAYYASLPAEP